MPRIQYTAPAYHLVLVLHQELDTLNGSSGGLRNSLYRKSHVRRHESAENCPLLTAETPPIMKSTVYGCQVSNQALAHKGRTAKTMPRIATTRTEELPRSLDLLHVGHFDGGKPGRRRKEEKETEWW